MNFLFVQYDILYYCTNGIREFFQSVNFFINREATGSDRLPPVVTVQAKLTQRVASARNSLQFRCRSIAACSHIHMINDITVFIFVNQSYSQRLLKINKQVINDIDRHYRTYLIIYVAYILTSNCTIKIFRE